MRVAQLDPAAARPQASLCGGKADAAVARALQARIDQRRRRERDEHRGIDGHADAEQGPAHYCGLARAKLALMLTRPAAASASMRAVSRRTCCACSASTRLSHCANGTAPRVMLR